MEAVKDFIKVYVSDPSVKQGIAEISCQSFTPMRSRLLIEKCSRSCDASRWTDPLRKLRRPLNPDCGLVAQPLTNPQNKYMGQEQEAHRVATKEARSLNWRHLGSIKLLPMRNFQTPHPSLCIAVALAASLTGCKGQAQDLRKPSPASEAKVQALVDKTLTSLRRIEGGSFWLGDFGVLMSDADKASDTPPGPNAKPGAGLPFTADADNKPPRWVTLDTFYLSAYKVTYGDFDAYVQANGLPAHPPQTEDVAWQRIWRKMRTSDDVPAGVHWDQAKAYCQWLGKLTGLPFDLPTEAQWEYAASNGKNSRRHPYPTNSGLVEKGLTHPSFAEKQKLLRRSHVYPVGLFASSPNGLYDLIGNGFDWVNDWYASDGYGVGSARNPRGPTTGTLKVLRGYPTNEDLLDFMHLTRRKLHPNNERYLDEDGDTPSVYGDQAIRCAVNAGSLHNGIKPTSSASQVRLPVGEKPSPSIAK